MVKFMRISAKKIVLKNCLQYDGKTLLSYTIEYPQFCSCSFQTCLNKINECYRNEALEYQKYCETDLFNMAVDQYKDDQANDFPIRVFEVMQVFRITYLNACIVSLYFDRYEYTGGAHGNTVRTSQTWNLKTCSVIRLQQMVRCQPDYKTYILKRVGAQIRRNPDIYFENYNELIAQTFDENNFYITPRGIVIYYQLYDIAPYSSGIREFLIPWGCGVRLCC